jgi:GntR family transcriptional regulator
MIQRRDTRPRYQQIAADVRSQIMSGILEPGAQLPSTLQLVERYGAANATVQRALAALKDEGFLDGRMGKGVFVRQALPLVVDVAAFFDPRASDYSYEILHVQEEEPPADVQRALGRPEGSMAVVRARVLSHGGEPIELSHSYYPAEIAAGTPLADHAKIRGGAPRLLADLGYPQQEFVDRVSTRTPTTDELQVLNIPDDVPIIRQLRVIYSTDGQAVEVSVLVKPGHFYELRYHQRIE